MPQTITVPKECSVVFEMDKQGSGRVFINDVEINWVKSIELKAVARQMTTVVLELMPTRVRVVTDSSTTTYIINPKKRHDWVRYNTTDLDVENDGEFFECGICSAQKQWNILYSKWQYLDSRGKSRKTCPKCK
jgi:hypothetical protein